jgi:hypothetical protein
MSPSSSLVVFYFSNVLLLVRPVTLREDRAGKFEVYEVGLFSVAGPWMGSGAFDDSLLIFQGEACVPYLLLYGNRRASVSELWRRFRSCLGNARSADLPWVRVHVSSGFPPGETLTCCSSRVGAHVQVRPLPGPPHLGTRERSRGPVHSTPGPLPKVFQSAIIAALG